MTHKTLDPGETIEISGTAINLIQNLDISNILDLSQANVAGRWFEIEARDFIKMQAPFYLRNSSDDQSLEIVYEEI